MFAKQMGSEIPQLMKTISQYLNRAEQISKAIGANITFLRYFIIHSQISNVFSVIEKLFRQFRRPKIGTIEI